MLYHMHTTQTQSKMASFEEASSECIRATQKTASRGTDTPPHAARCRSWVRTRAPQRLAATGRRSGCTLTACRRPASRRPRQSPGSTRIHTRATGARERLRDRASAPCALPPHAGRGDRATGEASWRGAMFGVRAPVDALLQAWQEAGGGSRAGSRRLQPLHQVERQLRRARERPTTPSRGRCRTFHVLSWTQEKMALCSIHVCRPCRTPRPSPGPKRGRRDGSETVRVTR